MTATGQVVMKCYFDINSPKRGIIIPNHNKIHFQSLELLRVRLPELDQAWHRGRNSAQLSSFFYLTFVTFC